jgi:uncharacterized protein (TIGR02285 family)
MKLLVSFVLVLLISIAVWFFISTPPNQPVRAEPSFIPAVTPDETIVASQLSINQLLKIKWGVAPEAPFHITQGPDQNNGICDVLLQRLAVHLPDVRQERLIDSHANIRLRMQQQQQVCFPCTLYQPEKAAAQGLIYSEPTHFYRPHGIVVKQTNVQAFTQKFGDPIDLNKLLSSDYQFSFLPARRFGELQPIIDKYPNNFKKIADLKSTQEIFRMVDQAILDFTIDYQSALIYYNRSEQHQLAFIPIAGQPALLAGAISCPDSNWGQLAIIRINKVIETLRQDPRLLENLRFWQGQELPAYQSSPSADSNPAQSP